MPSCHEAHDFLSGERVAALGELESAVVDLVQNDTAFLLRRQLFGGNGDGTFLFFISTVRLDVNLFQTRHDLGKCDTAVSVPDNS